MLIKDGCLIVIVCLLIAMTGCGQEKTAIPFEVVEGKRANAMDTFLTRLHDFGFHGSILVAQDDDILLHKAYGLASRPDDRENTTSTLFSTGSVTKQFTAAAILKLEMDGHLKTTDSITSFFENVPDDKIGITIHHLLTHSSGFPDSFGPDESELNRDKFLEIAMSCGLSYPVGDHYEYSNTGYSLLAAIVEIVSGAEYEAYLQEHFFKPLGMAHTGLKLIETPDPQVSLSHNEEMSYPSPLDRPDDYYNLKGNGGILSTPADMYRWRLSLKNRTILSEAACRKLFTPYIKEYEDGESYYGYGWVVQKTQSGDTLIWHNGGAMPHGWSCAVYYYLQADLECIVFSNAVIEGSLPVDNIALIMARICNDMEYVMPPEVVSIPPDEYKVSAGVYELDNETILVQMIDDRLQLAPMGQNVAMALFPSPYAEMLPKYNDRTTKVVRLIADKKFDEASAYFDEAPGENMWKSMLREWWQAIDERGTFKGVEIQGTVMGGGAHTYCLLEFDKETVNCRFFWMAGKCRGMATSDNPLFKEFLPQSSTVFAGYSVKSGSIIIADFSEEGILTIKDGDRLFTARLGAPR
jgi:CubicO group peptidase (beta-lactamase class C family)